VGAEPGAGQVCKICNQIAIGGALAGVSEAFAVARKAGVDPAKVREALLGGFAASRVLEVHGERMIKRNYVPGFRARLYQKDLRLASELPAPAVWQSRPLPSSRNCSTRSSLRAGPISTTRRLQPSCSASPDSTKEPRKPWRPETKRNRRAPMRRDSRLPLAQAGSV